MHARTVKNGPLGLYFGDPKKPQEVEVGHKSAG